MSTEIEVISSDTDKIVDQVNYRNLTFSVWESKSFQIYYTIIAGKVIPICSNKLDYITQIKDTVDVLLNLVYDFNIAKLIRFQNGMYEDIKLIYWPNFGRHDQSFLDKRCLKIYLVKDILKCDINTVILQAKQDLEKYLNSL